MSRSITHPGNKYFIGVHHGLYQSLSAMKNLESLSQIYAYGKLEISSIFG